MERYAGEHDVTTTEVAAALARLLQGDTPLFLEAREPPPRAPRFEREPREDSRGERAPRPARESSGTRSHGEGAPRAPRAFEGGHEGARDGRGHFTVRITSEAFAGKAPLARHRAVYAALGDMMQTDIHALAIRARAPGEPD